MKCGYFEMREFTNPFRVVYSCRKYSLIAGTEMSLCDGCIIVNGEPCIPDFEKIEDDEEE